MGNNYFEPVVKKCPDLGKLLAGLHAQGGYAAVVQVGRQLQRLALLRLRELSLLPPHEAGIFDVNLRRLLLS